MGQCELKNELKMQPQHTWGWKPLRWTSPDPAQAATRRGSCPRLCLIEFWLFPRMQIPQPFWAPCSSVWPVHNIPEISKDPGPERFLLSCFSSCLTNNKMLCRQELVVSMHASHAQGRSSVTAEMFQTSFLKWKLTTLYLQRHFGEKCSRKCHCVWKKKINMRRIEECQQRLSWLYCGWSGSRAEKVNLRQRWP